MAAIFIVAGGILGFASALISLIIAEVGILTALAIWSGVGLVFFALGLTVALMPRPATRPDSSQSQSA